MTLLARLPCWLALLPIAAPVACQPEPEPAAERELFDFARDPGSARIEGQGGTGRVVRGPAGQALLVTLARGAPWPAVVLAPHPGPVDLSGFEYVAVTLRNLSDRPERVFCRVAGAGGSFFQNSMMGSALLRPGVTDTVYVPLHRLTQNRHGVLTGMRYYPVRRKAPLDTTRVARVVVFAKRPSRALVLEVDRAVAGGRYRPPRAQTGPLLPLVDQFGQYRHDDWPGKTHRVEDLAARRAEEAADLEAHPGPAGRNRFGGWEAGPQLEATGAFRVHKHEGRWWLVDPEGRLFWSHGITCVRPNIGLTPLTDRLDYFEGLPDEQSPLARFYSQLRSAPMGPYKDREWRGFNFTAANLWRKYGPGWPREFADVSHRRLRSWGMNTIANFSSPGVYLSQRTPYAVGVHYRSAPIQGSRGYWHQFPDVFDPRFRTTLLRTFNTRHRAAARDPWCIGFFVDNEMSWGGPLYLALAALQSPAGQACKQALVADLRSKYETVERLNEAWGTQHASWDALLASTTPPDRRRAADDLRAFTTRAAELYFATCKEVVREVAPDRLYLGCRFTPADGAHVYRAAAKSCDALSANLYWSHLEGFELPGGVDLPLLIGEFDFVALDRGLFHPGLQPVPTQEVRAASYERYVRSALLHPAVVGTHWYMYYDLAATGNDNGLNIQCGFLDIADTPYPETIAASRRVGYPMYEIRAEAPR